MDWHHIEGAARLSPGEKCASEIAGREILVCRVGDDFFATSNRCTHAAWPLVGEPLTGFEIQCTLHGARFDVRDGCPTGGPASRGLTHYSTELRDGEVYVSLPG